MKANIPGEERQTRQIYRTAYFVILPAIAAGIGASLLGPEHLHRPLLLGTLILTLLCLHLSITATRRFAGHEEQRRITDDEVRASQAQMEQLFAMTDMLQSADCHEHAGAVLEATSKRLLTEFGGALYVFNNSRDRLDLIRSWNFGENDEPVETLLPETCWAIKRGKPHFNDQQEGSLNCFHHQCELPSVEIPMMARGTLFGLLILASGHEDAHARLNEVSRIARALADSMSLALSNIALNEQLKTRSMRDPLTGLYNRRYMEDALERAYSGAARNKTPISVMMIDLDNFKSLNDDHGHAKGDAVLRDVAAGLVGSLRPSDTVSRYGGEELFLILPDTAIADAETKAEALRIGIERLSETHGMKISASFGVAEFPTSVSSSRDLIAAADSALYVAKRDGKNCVRIAGTGHGAGGASPEFQLKPKLVS